MLTKYNIIKEDTYFDLIETVKEVFDVDISKNSDWETMKVHLSKSFTDKEVETILSYLANHFPQLKGLPVK